MKDDRTGCRTWTLTLALAGLAAFSERAQGAERWIAIGPEGGRVVALASAGAGSRTLYATLDEGGLWRSTDGGGSWQPRREGLPPGTSRALAVDPGAAGTLYLGRSADGVWKSVDGGGSWTQVAGLLDGQAVEVQVLGYDPASGTLWAGLVPKAGQAPLYRSADGGGHWTAIELGPAEERVTALAFGGGDVYVGTAFQGVFRGSVDGLTWEPTASELQVLSLAYAGGVLYAATASGLEVSGDRGATWSPRIEPPPNPQSSLPSYLTFAAIAVSPDDPRLLYLAYEVQLGLIPETRGLFRSTDEGVTHTAVAGGLPSGAPRALLVEAGRGGAVWAAPGALGVWRSEDGVADWRSRNRGLRAASVTKILADPKRPSILYAAVEGVGAMRSTDRGESWSLVNLGGQFGGLQALDPRQPSTLYAFGGWVGPPFLGRGTNGGRRWTRLRTGGEGYLSAFALDPARPERLYTASTGFGAAIQRSRDGGASWSGAGILCLLPHSLAVATTGVVYAGGSSRCGRAGEIEGGVYRSDDGGVTFLNRIAGLPSLPRVRVVAVDPARPATLFAGMEYFGSFTDPSRRGVFRSRNRAESWERVEDLDGLAGLPADFAFAPYSPRSIWLATFGDGIWRSGDAGESFRPLAAAGLPTGQISDLEFDRAQPATLYAGTRGGLFRLVDGGAGGAAETAAP